MSKIAQYLNEHILGDVSINPDLRKEFSIDRSILSIRPEIIVYPRSTGDLRKVARFAYQLSEKGHQIGITPRGNGMNSSAAAIGKGIVIDSSGHMNNILEFDAKQRLVRVQPGLRCDSLDIAMKAQGFYLPAISTSQQGTIGGAISEGVIGDVGDSTSHIGESTKELEVVLANGDIIQTRRYSKREISKKIAQTDFEGEIYRKLEALIEDNESLIATIDQEVCDNAGYNSIAKVRAKDGSMDLTPLFVGAEGTLGIISEMIMQVDFYNGDMSAVAMSFSSQQALRDMFDEVRKLSPHRALVLDGKIISMATSHGYSHNLIKQARESHRQIAGILLCSFADFSERARKRKVKKCAKIANSLNATAVVSSVDKEEVDAILALDGVIYNALNSGDADLVAPPLFDGVYVPHNRFEEFIGSVRKLELQNDINLPYHGDIARGIYNFYPSFKYRTVQERRRMINIYDMFCGIVDACGGVIAAGSSEGRMKVPFVNRNIQPELLDLYAKVRQIFDPNKTLNPGVKQPVELREIIGALRQSYTHQR